MKLDYKAYYRCLLGCYIGKSVGGTLGMPYEGEERLLNLTYYDPVPTEMVANDDLDLQVMFLESVRRNGLPVHREYLGRTYLESLRFSCDEYGTARRNLTLGLKPPLSGYFDSKFHNGMGSAIRSELWACLAPGDPELAAALSREDACIDHAFDGIDATAFIAAMESAAFVEKDVRRLIEIGLSVIPAKGRFPECIRFAIERFDACHDYVQVRKEIREKFYHQNFTDVALNFSFIVLGLLNGEGNFDKALCTAVNCGNDTDCTGATIGALLGIIDPDSISEKWTKPIGNKLVIGGNMLAMHEVETIDDFCEQIAAISIEVQRFYHSTVTTENVPEFPAFAQFRRSAWHKSADGVALKEPINNFESVLSRCPLYVSLIYPKTVALAAGGRETYTLRILDRGRTESFQAELTVPDGFAVEPATALVTLKPNEPAEVAVTVSRPARVVKNAYLNPLDIRLVNDEEIIEVSAGLPLSLPWLRCKTDRVSERCPVDAEFCSAERVEVPCHFQTVPKGHWILTTEIKEPVGKKNAFLVAEGTRKMRVWLDGKCVDESDGTYYVPAFHRKLNFFLNDRKRVNLGGWTRVTVEVFDGDDGEIFIGFGEPYGYDWLMEIETRPSMLKEE